MSALPLIGPEIEQQVLERLGCLKEKPYVVFVYVFQLAVGSASFFASGQAVNSQFGPVLPTAAPSGQTFTSCVQAFCLFEELFKNKYAADAIPITIKKRITEIKVSSFNFGLVGGGGLAGICSVGEA